MTKQQDVLYSAATCTIKHDWKQVNLQQGITNYYHLHNTSPWQCMTHCPTAITATTINYVQQIHQNLWQVGWLGFNGTFTTTGYIMPRIDIIKEIYFRQVV